MTRRQAFTLEQAIRFNTECVGLVAVVRSMGLHL